VLLRAVTSSTFEGLRRRAGRIIADERFHQRYADGRVRELAGSPAFQRDLADLLPETLCWFGPKGERGLELLAGAGIVSQRNEELRQEFSEAWTLVDETGVELPVARGDYETGTYPELPWSQWNSLERRLTASPVAASP
jgi:1,2-phenylacetyl-CoA epoxidase catalytic subunit